MSRVQLALNVDDLERAITFYSTLFDTAPAKREPGYANFAIERPPLKLVLLENSGQGGTINHLGVEVDTSEQVHGEIARLSEAGLFTEEQIATTCCFATQDKVWVTGPNAEKWEVYTVLADTDNFGAAPEFATDDAEAVQACRSTGSAPSESAVDESAACCTPGAKDKATASGTCRN
ncbi:ArsI/CadI family heavy metal resistance metalloenzyme [Nocardia sp. NPDC052254]|uniref:ArsI/CadI family heavy metal resistance metalloenzyme n=1 Tax=Nocardia sp. NPDC052254 TaxID=3155681 RepID=UPI0034484DB3